MNQIKKLTKHFYSTVNCSLTSLNSSLEATNATHIVEQHERSDRLSLLTNLIEILRHGVDIGIRILLYYRLSVQIGKSYQILLTLNNPLNFLKEIVRSPYDRKLELARDIITTYQIENQEVANFLSEEIVAHITQVIEGCLFQIYLFIYIIVRNLPKNIDLLMICKFFRWFE